MRTSIAQPTIPPQMLGHVPAAFTFCSTRTATNHSPCLRKGHTRVRERFPDDVCGSHPEKYGNPAGYYCVNGNYPSVVAANKANCATSCQQYTRGW